ncbi:MAG: HmuY family protein, partial [Gemmatimonadales bacterium]
ATTHRALQGAEFSTVTRAPAGGYAAASEVDPLATPIRWYRYSMITHLLKPSGAVFVVRTTQGNYAKLELLSYYCTEMRPGCITLRYAYQGATGVDLLE